MLQIHVDIDVYFKHIVLIFDILASIYIFYGRKTSEIKSVLIHLNGQNLYNFFDFIKKLLRVFSFTL